MPFGMTPGEFASLLANIAGVIGLILALYTFFVSRADKRPRLTVTIEKEEVEIHYEGDSDEDEPWPPEPSIELIAVTVANPGDRRIKITSLEVERVVREGPRRFRRRPVLRADLQGAKEIPFFLSPLDAVSFTARYDDFVYSMFDDGDVPSETRLRATVTDATGNHYRSSWLKL